VYSISAADRAHIESKPTAVGKQAFGRQVVGNMSDASNPASPASKKF
jgi:hypothetical protein